MLKIVALALFIAPVALAQGSRPPVEAGADGVYSVVEVQPELVGGLSGLQERLAYPEAARTDGSEGIVVVEFVVAGDGSVTDAAVLRSPDSRLAEAALEAVRASEFTPGRVGGEPVPVRFALPVTFRLSEDDRATSAPGDGAKVWGGGVHWDMDFGDLEADLDHRTTMEVGLAARVMGGVAYDGEPFPGLAPGTAEVRFMVSTYGRAAGIEVVRAESPALERFARFQALAARFDPSAVGRQGGLTVTVLEVGE